ERVLLRLATPSLLPTLGVQPRQGRNFLPEETVAGRDRVALISDALWRRHFGAAADTVGKNARLDGTVYQIVGILPPGLVFDHYVDIWLPLSTALEGLEVRNAHFLNAIGRRRPGASVDNVVADMTVIGQRQRDSWPDLLPPGWGMRAKPYLEEVVGDVRLP